MVAAEDWREFRGQKVGVITNPTGILSDLRSIVDEMHEAGAVDIVGVFGPEHGFRGTAQAGDSEGTYIDPRTGLTVYDAYGANAAKMEQLFTDGRGRDRRLRHPGRRRAVLHLHLDDVHGDASPPSRSGALRGARPAQPRRRHALAAR